MIIDKAITSQKDMLDMSNRYHFKNLLIKNIEDSLEQYRKHEITQESVLNYINSIIQLNIDDGRKYG